MTIETRRAFDFVRQEKPADAHVVLVDRVWPRGLRKDELGLDEWARHLAPSTELRQWFNHDPDKWPEFLYHYQNELQHQDREIDRLARLAARQRVILLYGARDREHNQAQALKGLLEQSA